MLLVADTTVISNFSLIGRLDLLEGIKGLCTTEEVWGELEVAKRRRVLEIAREDLRVEVLKMGEDDLCELFVV
jgi:predicted nucleic acid-binding protein